jgi:hypothetical protein
MMKLRIERGAVISTTEKDTEFVTRLSDSAVVSLMLAVGTPITLEKYIEVCYWGEKKFEDLSAEEIAELPDIFRDEID